MIQIRCDHTKESARAAGYSTPHVVRAEIFGVVSVDVCGGCVGDLMGAFARAHPTMATPVRIPVMIPPRDDR